MDIRLLPHLSVWRAAWRPRDKWVPLRIKEHQGAMSASEALTQQMAAELEAAWGTAPFDVYAATETAGIASPCEYRNRHVYEDVLIVEPVDQVAPFVLAWAAGEDQP